MRRFAQDVVVLSSVVIFAITVGFYFFTKNFPKTSPASFDNNVLLDESGSPKYSYGSCLSNGNCQPAGCSSHICSSDLHLASTCEFSEDFPDSQNYFCGCVNSRCVWSKK